MRLRAPLPVLLAALLVAPLALLAASPGPASAADTGTLGSDVSWPNCRKGMGIPERPSEGQPMPVPGTRWVVMGLTNGIGWSTNPCLPDQVAWTSDRRLSAGAYALTTYPDADELATYGGTGTLAERLHRAGVAQAQFAVRWMHASGLDAPFVWVDVEPSRVRAWSSSTTANNAVIDGVLEGYAAAGLRTGFYSYTYGWDQITGGRRSSAPTWVPSGSNTRAAGYARCSQASFSGGPVRFGQWTVDHHDENVTCPGVSDTDPTLFSVPAGPRDLVAVAANSTGSGKVEVHRMTGRSGYRTWSQHVATSLGAVRAADWVFLTGASGPYGGGDLFALHVAGTATGKVELTVLSADSGYQAVVRRATLPLALPAPGTAQWSLADVTGTGASDLVLALGSGTGSGRTEVHALSQSSGYATWVVHAATALHPVSAADWRLVADRRNGDLYAVAHGVTGSGRVEVHALTAASGWQSYSVHAATALARPAAGTVWQWSLFPPVRGAAPDLYAVETTGGASGRTEVHPLSASSGYGAYVGHWASALSTVPSPRWTLLPLP